MDVEAHAKKSIEIYVASVRATFSTANLTWTSDYENDPTRDRFFAAVQAIADDLRSDIDKWRRAKKRLERALLPAQLADMTPEKRIEFVDFMNKRATS